MENVASFNFFDGLESLLVHKYRAAPVVYRFRDHPGVKDPIETMGIPHTEVDVILANGRSVGFDYQLSHGDTIAVYPPFSTMPAVPLVRLSQAITSPATFVLDVHLGKLARRLRLLGFDTLYRNDFTDAELLRLAVEQERILLTRDLGILKHRHLMHGTLVRSDVVDEQVRQVLDRYHLHGQIRPWLRCMICNGLIETVTKGEVLHCLEPKTRRYYEEFQRCTGCGQIYWKGSHHKKIKKWLASMLP
ncbi:MAG: twitching motility protein PilT [Desulfuromonadales bacterium]|nr:twitching motility protein PilT [Desulfuromonadales bacterium]